MKYDLHIHTEYCGHAAGMSVGAIIRRAEELELETIAITDHIFGPGDVGIIGRIRGEVEAIETKCRVIVGAEIDVDGGSDDGRLVTEEIDGIDFVVAGFHYVPTVGNYPMSPDDCGLRGERFFDVWRRSLLGIVSNPKIDGLAHPGRLLASCVDLDVYFEDALCVFAEAARISSENGIAWEINELSGSRIRGGYLERWHEIFEVGLEHGVKLYYGSDAHSPAMMGVDNFAGAVIGKLGRENICRAEEIVGQAGR